MAEATSEQLSLANEKVEAAQSKQKNVEELTSWRADLIGGVAAIELKLRKTINTFDYILWMREADYGIKAALTIAVRDLIDDRIVTLEAEIQVLKDEAEAILNQS
jgi:hypothetical protein